MKRLLLIIAPIFFVYQNVSAQNMKIVSGSTFKMTGTAYTMVLSSTALDVATTAIQADSLVIKGSGANTAISSVNPLTLHSLNVNMNGGQTMTLQQDINVHNQVVFQSGLLDLNNHIVKLDPTAMLVGEQNSSRAISPLGGEIRITQALNAPQDVNPGNLGMVITSTANLGSTRISRGHKLQTMNGAGSCIERYYDITPQFNNNLSALLRSYYFQQELNGQVESSLRFSRSIDSGSTWANAGTTTVDASLNFANLSGVQSMGRFTLTNINIPLPIRLVRWESVCDKDQVQLKWEVATPKEVVSYTVEESNDGQQWEPVIHLPATTAFAYAVTDHTPASYYRLASNFNNGHSYFSGTLKENCKDKTSNLELLQNPVTDVISIRAFAAKSNTVIVKVWDVQGRLLQEFQKVLPEGASIFTIDVSNYASGFYNLLIAEEPGLPLLKKKVIVE
jgi:hypothetical protein